MTEFFSSEIMQTIFTTVAIPLLVAVGGFLVAYLRKKTMEITNLNINEQVRQYLREAADAIVTAVDYTYQTYVETLKKAGSFDQAAQEKAFSEAKRVALSLMTQEAKELLADLYEDVDLWLTAKIEQAVQSKKLSA